MPGDTVTFDLEVPTPEEAARQRALGVTLPGVSEAAADPRTHSDFVDNRLIAVGYGVYIGGIHLYVTDVGLPLLVPQAMIDLSGRPALAIGPEIYPDRDAATAAVRRAAPLRADAPAGTVRYAYFRAYGGLILPTTLSDVSAPRTIGTAREAMATLGRTVSEELVATALSLLGARLIGGAYTRLVRALNRWGGAPVRPPQIEPPPARPPGTGAGTQPGTGTAPPRPPQPPAAPPPGAATTPPAGAATPASEAAAGLGRRIGEAVRRVAGGRIRAIAEQVTAARLPQADAAVATGEASRVAFGRIGGTVRLPNGDLVVPSVMVGPNQPVFVIRPNGVVRPARATISVTQPVNIQQPITVSNIVVE
jgi:hypothetical protein